MSDSSDPMDCSLVLEWGAIAFSDTQMSHKEKILNLIITRKCKVKEIQSWASLVAQLVKNLPAMWETWVQSPDWKDPLEKGMAAHSSIHLGNPMDRAAWRATVHGVTVGHDSATNT